MDVLMPQLGETVAEGKITHWFKSVGDAVKPGDNLFEIETDKVSMEVPATSAGVLAEIRVPAGEVAPVGAVVAVIADGGRCGRNSPSALRQSPPQGGGPAAPGHRVPASQAIERQSPRRTRGRSVGADRARSVPRSAHARAQFRPGAARRRHRRDAAGAPARRRRPASISARTHRLRPAWPHRRARCRDGRSPARAAAARPRSRRPRSGADRSRRSIATCRSRKCRSTACAGPSPRG